MPILDIKDLTVEFSLPGGQARAVDGVSFSVEPGETVGVVGESGCGKTVTSLSILRLIQPPGKIVGGSIFFNGVDLLTLSDEEIRRVRGAKIAMVFQEPMTALNPVFTIGDQIAEGVTLHKKVGKKEAYALAVETLRKVHIPAPEKRIHEYPHQLSGGMRQRAMIAMALSCGPSILIADEPTTALDVTIQAQILDLLGELRETTGTAVILVTHDLGVVAQTCDHVVVMYAGRVVERAPVTDLFSRPQHPYTRGLLASAPRQGERGKRLTEIKGMVPALLDMPQGCRFHPRCPDVFDRCLAEEPTLAPTNAGSSKAACWLCQPESVPA